MALERWFIKDFSVEVLEYPEITIPEQGLKSKNQMYYATPLIIKKYDLIQEVEFGNVIVWLHSVSLLVMHKASWWII